MNSRRNAFAILTALLLAASVAARADNLIVPGQRIGVIRIGMTSAELYRAAGEPDNSATAYSDPRHTFYDYGGKFPRPAGPQAGLGTMCEDGRVLRVWVRDPKYKTAQGIGVGDSQLALLAKMGKSTPEQVGLEGEGFTRYAYRGIAFIVRDGRVESITVTAR